MFKEITTLKEMRTIINTKQPVFVYITQPNCSVCHGLFPQIEKILDKFPMIHTFKINAAKIPAIAGTYQVFTAPTLLLFVDGREYIREARFIQTQKLQEKISRIIDNIY